MSWPFIGIWYREADIDIKDEKKSGIDTKYPFINYIDADLDKKYLLLDILNIPGLYEKQKPSEQLMPMWLISMSTDDEIVFWETIIFVNL